MRKLALASCLFWPWVAAASPCGSVVPLSTYITSTSCTDHGILFDSWSYIAGGSTITAADIMVIPSVVGPVFEFAVLTVPGGWSSATPATITPEIRFHASPTSSVVGSRLYAGSAGATGTGSGSIAFIECRDGIWVGPVCLGGTTSSLLKLVTDPIVLAEHAVPPTLSIDVRIPITLTGGGAGTAGVLAFEAGFYTVPEPATLVLSFCGGCAILLGRRKRS